MGTHGLRLFPLTVAGSESIDLTPPPVQKLERQVAQPSDAHNAHPVGWSHAILHDGVEDSNSSAKQRSSFLKIHSCRQRCRPVPMTADAVGKPAMPADNCLFRICAKILVSGKARTTSEATLGIPTQTDRPPDRVSRFTLQTSHCGPRCYDTPNHFMARYEGILGQAPFVIEHRKIGVTNSAMNHFNLHLFGLQFAHLKFERTKLSARFCSGESLNAVGHICLLR
jgi:hypothetical protein